MSSHVVSLPPLLAPSLGMPIRTFTPKVVLNSIVAAGAVTMTPHDVLPVVTPRIDHGRVSSSGSQDHSPTDSVREKRLLQNRMAAARSREKKRTVMESLQSQLDAANAELAVLRARVAADEHDNSLSLDGAGTRGAPAAPKCDCDETRLRMQVAVAKLQDAEARLAARSPAAEVAELQAIIVSQARQISALQMQLEGHEHTA
eukprot:c25362_g1_i1.p3 GENE.c25362_g1_i1~~c25362_g1_i1.p3  ORF type:complete len:202 (-),score=40.54 c25362_g1_i1:91-696(-)